MAGKGDRNRTKDWKKFREGYERAFGKRSVDQSGHRDIWSSGEGQQGPGKPDTDGEEGEREVPSSKVDSL